MTTQNPFKNGGFLWLVAEEKVRETQTMRGIPCTVPDLKTGTHVVGYMHSISRS